MDGELGCVERTLLAEILSRRNDLVPRLECHLCPLLESERLLAREHAVDPSLLIRAMRVERRKRMRQLPEARILADPLLDDKPLENVGPARGEKEHRLVNAV